MQICKWKNSETQEMDSLERPGQIEIEIKISDKVDASRQLRITKEINIRGLQARERFCLKE